MSMFHECLASPPTQTQLRASSSAKTKSAMLLT
jgi:hypothetical protein